MHNMLKSHSNRRVLFYKIQQKNLAELNAVLTPPNHYQLSESSQVGEKLSILNWLKK